MKKPTLTSQKFEITPPRQSQNHIQSSSFNHRFSNFIKELSLEKLKFNSQIEYTTNQTNRVNFTSRDDNASISTNYLTQSVLEILNNTPRKKENSVNYSSEKVKKAAIPIELKQKIREVVREISIFEINSMRKKTEIKAIEDLLKREEKVNHHKTVICEESYNKMTENNARNEDELLAIEEKLKEIEENRPETQKLLQELAEKKNALEARKKKHEEDAQNRLQALRKKLMEIKNENQIKEEKINCLEDEMERSMRMSKSSMRFQINRKDREIDLLKQDIDLLNVRLADQELTSNAKKEELSEQLSEIIEKIDEIKSNHQESILKKNKEKSILSERLENLHEKLETIGENREVYDTFEKLGIKNKSLNELKSKNENEFLSAKEVLLRELDQKSNFIKEKQKKLEKMTKEYEKLEKNSKDIQENVKQKLQSGTKKIEAKKQKNKMLRNLLQNMPKELIKINEKNNKSVLENKKDEKNMLERDLQLLTQENNEQIAYLEEMKELETDKLMEQIELQNLENELNEIKRIVKGKQELLIKTKEIRDNCMMQFNNNLL